MRFTGVPSSPARAGPSVPVLRPGAEAVKETGPRLRVGAPGQNSGAFGQEPDAAAAYVR